MKSHEHAHDLNIKKIDRLGSTRVRLTLEFSGEAVREHEKAKANQYLAVAKIPGFRPGKAPIGMVRERYKDEIKKELISHFVEAGLYEALQKTNLNPVNRPRVEFGDLGLTEGKPFEFHAEFEVEPEIELRNYKGIPLEPSEVAVTEEEVAQTLENLRDRFSLLEPVSDTKASPGIFAVVEIGYQLTEDPSKKEAPKPFTVELGKEKLLPALDRTLVEMSVGERKSVTDVFPGDYDDKNLANKEATFDCHIIELKKKVLPELDDTLASQVKSGATLESLKADIRESILSTKREDEDRARRDAIVDHLVKNHSFDVPSSMVEHQAHSLMKWMERDLKQKGVSLSDLKNEDLSSLKNRAEQMVRTSLLLKEIASKEKIALDEAKVKARIDAIAGQLDRSHEDTEKFLSGKGMLDRLRDEIMTDQVFDFLIQNAQIREKGSNG